MMKDCKFLYGLTNGRHNFVSFADDCASVTCQNYGDYLRLSAACQCECRAGFSGDNCGTGVDPMIQTYSLMAESDYQR